MRNARSKKFPGLYEDRTRTRDLERDRTTRLALARLLYGGPQVR